MINGKALFYFSVPFTFYSKGPKTRGKVTRFKIK